MIPLVFPVDLEKIKRLLESLVLKAHMFFAARGLYSTQKDKIVGGVCCGISKRLGVSSGSVRIATTILFAIAPLSVGVYVLLWWLMPQEP